MKRNTINRVVKWYGGKVWLKNLEPATLFNFLEGKYRGTEQVLKIVLNDNEGWLLFVDATSQFRKKVMGFFYQKGEWLIDYSGDYIFLQNIGWRFYKDTFFDSNPKEEDFTKTVSEITAMLGCD